MPNWNAYKVFANGKRAKAPYTTFEAEESQHFFESILPTLTEKLQKADWIILNTDEPQERKAEVRDEAEDKFTKDRIRFLSRLANSRYPRLRDKKTEACLMMNGNTEWKWAWCIAESGTHKFLGLLSECFDNRNEAMEWIETKVGTPATRSET